jgi:hypothetical protein
VIHPEERLWSTWCLGMVFPMTHTSIVTPYYIGMMQEPPTSIFVLDRIVDFLFVVDLGLNFMLAYRSSITGGANHNHKAQSM